MDPPPTGTIAQADSAAAPTTVVPVARDARTPAAATYLAALDIRLVLTCGSRQSLTRQGTLSRGHPVTQLPRSAVLIMSAF